jgi:hypothetical protein
VTSFETLFVIGLKLNFVFLASLSVEVSGLFSSTFYEHFLDGFLGHFGATRALK